MSEYAKSGVSHARKESGLAGLVGHLRGTLLNNPRARVAGEQGYYASVLELADWPVALALSTDSVGTKVLVAQRAGRHDTIGIDCVAMNANDVICVGADPVAMLDYIGVDVLDAGVAEQLGRGLAEGARRAELSIPGGEIAQVPDLVKGEGEGSHYDLIGTCVGVLPRGTASDGSAVRAGDVVIGIASTGLHSNGFSLARRIVFETLRLDVDDDMPDCGRSVADELLEPTALYVRECKALQRRGVEVHALLNITGGAFTNLLRVAARGVGFVLDALPPPPPVFGVLQRAGRVSDAEMHQVFNMGVGFAVIAPVGQADAVIDAARAEGKTAWVIGRVVADPGKRVAIVRGKGTPILVGDKAKGALVECASLPSELCG